MKVISQDLAVIEHERMRQAFLCKDAYFCRIIGSDRRAHGPGNDNGGYGMMARIASWV